MARQELQAQYDQEGPRLIRRLTTELQLAAAAASTTAAAGPDAPAPLIFQGPVALVQTGDGSRATVHQHIDAGMKTEIATAITGLTEALEKPENATLGNRGELLDAHIVGLVRFEDYATGKMAELDTWLERVEKRLQLSDPTLPRDIP